MSSRPTHIAALVLSAAFVFSSSVLAQAPIVDATRGMNNSSETQQPRQQDAQSSVGQNQAVDTTTQSELFYQLQLLQQEVMQLRGIVEEQSYSLKRLKDQNMERYIDLDRRLGQLATSSASNAGPSNSSSRAPVAEPTAPIKLSSPVKAQEGEKEAYDAAYKLVTSRSFDSALDQFKQLLMDYPDGKYAPNSYYWVGELYQVITPQDLEAARQAFTQLLEQYPAHAKVPDAMYKLGKVYFLKGNRTQSRQYLEQVIAEYSRGSNSSAADKARQFLNTNF